LRIRLLKKFAEVINDFDLTDRTVGEVFDCSRREGRMLVLEGWAELVDEVLGEPPDPSPATETLENAQLSQSIWMFIDSHREGKKDKLA
jgi:hypothetical protein